MWFLNQFDTTSPAYNIPFAVRLSGPLDTAALTAAASSTSSDPHETLRTIYPTPRRPAPGCADGHRPRADRHRRDENELGEQTRCESRHAGFDVATRNPPARRPVRNRTDSDHVLAVVVHHICADGSSHASTRPRSHDRLHGPIRQGTHLDAPTVQYVDYTLWQRETLGSEDDPESIISAANRATGTHTSPGSPNVLELPTDHPRPPQNPPWRPPSTSPSTRTPTAHSPNSHENTRDRVHGAARRTRHPPRPTLRTPTTSPSAPPSPDAATPHLDNLVGMFVNTLVLRTPSTGPAPSPTPHDIRDTDLAAFEHADLPFERLVEVLNPPRSTTRHPLFQVMLVFQNTAPVALELPSLTTECVDAGLEQAKFDLTLMLDESVDAGIAGHLVYATDLFDEPTARAFADRYLRLLDTVVRSNRR